VNCFDGSDVSSDNTQAVEESTGNLNSDGPIREEYNFVGLSV